MKTCVGFLVVMFCQDAAKPAVVSDFCNVAGPDIARLRSLSDGEVKALKRPRKEAILNLRRAQKKLCQNHPE